MNDVKSLLERALNDGPTATLAARSEMDPAADLLRGRAKLRKRRTAGFAGAAVVALGFGIVPLALSNTGDPSGGTQAQPARTQPATEKLPTIELAAYTGKQVPGYKVAWMPKGWVIQGGTSTHLTIAPKDAKDKDPSHFVGKLVVGLVWHGFKPITAAEAKRDGLTSQPVAGRPGWLAVDSAKESALGAKSRAMKKAASGSSVSKYIPGMALTYQGAKGQWMYIAVPQSVGWTAGEMAKFASGVTILKGAAKPF
jgi:hypothetical protein